MSDRVYIAGPYTKGDVCVNVRAALDAAEQIAAAGMVPFIPHLTHFWHLVHSHEYSWWLQYDLHWLEACHAVVRLPGESSGADGEVARAQSLGIPVYVGLDALFDAVRA